MPLPYERVCALGGYIVRESLRKKLREALFEAELQILYLEEKAGEGRHGTTEATLARLRDALNELRGC